jgi:hypothetical protein
MLGGASVSDAMFSFGAERLSLDAAVRRGDVKAAILPGSLALNPGPDHLHISVEVLDAIFLGDTVQLTCSADGLRIVSKVSAAAVPVLPEVGATLKLYAPSKAVVLVEDL